MLETSFVTKLRVTFKSVDSFSLEGRRQSMEATHCTKHTACNPTSVMALQRASLSVTSRDGQRMASRQKHTKGVGTSRIS
eukprot:1206567-Amphidinium_carterae.1